MASSALDLHINGRPRSLAAADPSMLDRILDLLELRGDRIAVEHNGEIVPRTAWNQTQVRSGDRLEIVHFVGGGTVREAADGCGQGPRP
jgi:thiamine biosynthesis protein ThiS